jgi:hypothetical protein
MQLPNKKIVAFLKLTSGTQEEIRTPTPIQAPAPQAGASTNFATWVCAANII